MSHLDATPISSLPGYSVSKEGKVFRGMVELSTSLNSGGYAFVQIIVNEKCKRILVHRLVAGVFLGLDRRDVKVLVDHIDQNKTNNRVINLRLVNHLQNRLHAVGRLDEQFTEFKKCGKCGNSKKRFEFAIRARNSDGKSAYCKTCEKEMRHDRSL